MSRQFSFPEKNQYLCREPPPSGDSCLRLIKTNHVNHMIDELIEKKIEEKVSEAIRDALDRQIGICQGNYKPVYTNSEMMELLDIDPKTLKKYRDDGLLGFTHPGDKYFYSYQDLLDFLMNKNIRYEAFNVK